MVVWIFVSAGILALVSWGYGPNGFAAGHWLFTYSDGAWRRGLPGTLFQLGGGTLDQHLIPLSLILYLVAVLAVARYVPTVLLAHGRVCWSRLVVALGVALSPAGFPFLAMGLGRFDTLLVLIAVAAGAVVTRHRGRARWLTVAGLLVGAVAVHEGALLLIGVWTVAFYGWRLAEEGHDSRAVMVRCAGLFVAPAAAAVAISRQVPPVPVEVLSSQYAAELAHWGPRAARIQYRSFGDNLDHTWSVISTNTGGKQALWDLITTIPVVAVCLALLAAVGWDRVNRPSRWLLAATTAPLLLTPFGTDWGRWAAFFAAFLTVSALIVLRHHEWRGTARIAVLLSPVLLGWTIFVGPIYHHGAPIGDAVVDVE